MTLRKSAILTVDLEDYRYQQLRDHLPKLSQRNPAEVERQTTQILSLFEEIKVQATFFTVGETVIELSPSLLGHIAKKHRIGCHGFEHRFIPRMGKKLFKEDIKRGKNTLEQIFGASVLSYRAPYFSYDGCDSWFGEALAEEDFRYDSSQRISKFPSGLSHYFPLIGSNGRVLEIPLPSIGIGAKRVTIIGGTYLRLLPLNIIQKLMTKAAQGGFIPIVYLHPYDIDPDAPRLAYPPWHYWRQRLEDKIRRTGRTTIQIKLKELAKIYSFGPLEERITG